MRREGFHMKVLRSVVLGLSVAVGAAVLAKGFVAENLFPTGVGSTWSYITHISGQPGPVNQSASVVSAKKNGSTTSVVMSYSQNGTPVQQETYLVTPTSVSRSRSGANGANVITPPLPVIKYPMTVGKSWTWKGNIAMPTGKFDGSATLKVVSKSKVKTAAKTFDAYEVRLDLKVMAGGSSADFVNTYWFAPGVGLVKQSMTVNGQTIEGSVSKYTIK